MRRWVVLALVACHAAHALMDAGSENHSLSVNEEGGKGAERKEVFTQQQQLVEQSESTQTTGGESSSGIALDKHDFDVTNNKGGDVKVEVNLAAPMTGDGGDDDGEDVTDLLRMMQPPVDDQINPLELMSMMKDLMQSMRPEEPPQVNISQVMEEFKQSITTQPAQQPDITSVLRDLTDAIKQSHSTATSYAPAPPPPNPETIINALQPPPAAPQPPFDVGQFMRELRETMATNKPPPTPPPGVDPQLLEMLRQTMSDMKDMHKDLLKAAAAPTPPSPPTSTSGSSTQPAIDPSNPTQVNFHPPPAPPPAIPAATAQEQEEKMRDMIQGILQQVKPPALPPMPTKEQDEEMDKLRDLIRQQALTAQKPIVLPPPIVGPHAQEHKQTVAPPPPPPQATSGTFQDQMKSMIASMIPPPQRIPAPPKIDVHHTQAQTGCCPPPTPEDGRSEVERCPVLNGVRRPRCKRDTPPTVQPMKCKKAGGCKTPPVVDEDGDVEVDWPGELPGHGIPAKDFNPQKLLKILCPGGLCPGQKALDPAMNPRSGLGQRQTASL